MHLRSAHGYYEAKLKLESLDGGNCSSFWATLHFIVEIPNLHGNCKMSYHIIVLVHIIMLPVIYNHLYATMYFLHSPTGPNMVVYTFVPKYIRIFTLKE